ncbi:sugar phosphate isomerase/epimerase [Fusobacterium animalis]|uniref:TIM barrel protein n=1 Tax=Fusobacterium animalis TaxID=76859 RepID=UPI0030CBD584
MYKLLNMADFCSNEEVEKDMQYFSKKYGFDGFELIKFFDEDNSSLKKYIKGYHMRFFPSWMELYLEDFNLLYAELKDKKYFKSLCGGHSKKELIEYYKRELKIAKELEVEYVVFHACNVKVTEAMTYDFKYSDKEVLDAVISIINEIFEDGEYDFKLLFENLWWSGLRLTNKEEIEYLLNGVKYKNVGFILDTGHMINNNRDIKNSKEGIEYIKKNIDNIGEYKNLIYGMHLNYSLSGEYVKKSIKENKEKNLSIEEIKENVYQHVGAIDYHDPFEDKEIIKAINSLPIKYLVFELIGNTREELEDKIQRQWKIFN